MSRTGFLVTHAKSGALDPAEGIGSHAAGLKVFVSNEWDTETDYIHHLPPVDQDPLGCLVNLVSGGNGNGGVSLATCEVPFTVPGRTHVLSWSEIR